MDNEVNKIAKELMLELLLTGEVIVFGTDNDASRHHVWVELIIQDYIKMQNRIPCITPKGRAWLDEQRS